MLKAMIVLVLVALSAGCVRIMHGKNTLHCSLTEELALSEVEIIFIQLESDAAVHKKCARMVNRPWILNLFVFHYYRACCKLWIPENPLCSPQCVIWYFDPKYLEEEITHCQGWIN